MRGELVLGFAFLLEAIIMRALGVHDVRDRQIEIAMIVG